MIGYNSRLDEIQAATLRVKLRHLDQWNKPALKKQHTTMNNFKDSPVITPYDAPDRKHIYHLYIIQTAERKSIAAGIYKKMESQPGSIIHYPFICKKYTKNLVTKKAFTRLRIIWQKEHLLFLLSRIR